MPAKRLLWPFVFSFVVLVGIAVLGPGWYCLRTVDTRGRAEAIDHLEARCRILEPAIAQRIAQGELSELQETLRTLAPAAGVPLTVIPGPGAAPVSSEDLTRDDEHVADAPEVIEAWTGGRGADVRVGRDARRRAAYVAIPVLEGDRVVGVIRGTLPLGALDQQLATLRLGLIGAAGVLLPLAACAAIWMWRSVHRPLLQIQQGVERFADGKLQHRIPVDGAAEFASLADALHRMAATLDTRIQSATRQRNEREAILASMVEGVLAVDTRQQVLSINRSAAALFGLQPEKCLGRSLEETVRSPQLQRLVHEVLTEHASVADEFALFTEEERFLHVQGAVLRDAVGELIGALVVLYDVTQLKRLENVRRDFVANVSHELKTPITSIKGYVETLLDGALNDPEDAQRFLRIVANQSDRLNSIIDDLLALSRVEQKAERAEIPLVVGSVRPVLQTAIEVSETKAQECGVGIELTCDPALEAPLNRPLLEQAVTNLIDNACKHSPPGSTVWVEATRQRHELIIEVRDQGCGIEAQHLPRLFERFYRVDKSRSRKLGGTGLGLAIVKHIAQAHHGHVKVDSTPNVGSRFQICLPLSVQQMEMVHATGHMR